MYTIWLTANKLTLNKEKNEYMIIGSSQGLDVFSNIDLDVITGEHNIQRVQNKKVLGIIIDDQLKWDKHNDGQCKTISKSIYSLIEKGSKIFP